MLLLLCCVANCQMTWPPPAFRSHRRAPLHPLTDSLTLRASSRPASRIPASLGNGGMARGTEGARASERAGKEGRRRTTTRCRRCLFLLLPVLLRLDSAAPSTTRRKDRRCRPSGREGREGRGESALGNIGREREEGGREERERGGEMQGERERMERASGRKRGGEERWAFGFREEFALHTRWMDDGPPGPRGRQSSSGQGECHHCVRCTTPEKISFRISLFHGICSEKRDCALN